MQNLAAAKLFKCLSEELRLRLLALLKEEELSGPELKHILGVPQSTLSRHLTVLRDNSLLQTRRQGPTSYYSLALPQALNGSGHDLMALLDSIIGEDRQQDRDQERLREVLEERRRAVHEHFESSGGSWDEFNAKHADRRAKDLALRQLIPGALTLVDVGCGSGYLLPELSSVAAQVIAIDNAPSQLERARLKTQELGLDNIEFRLGELGALPLEERSVDGLFAHLSLHHAPQPASCIHDMAQSLKPGATLVITDFMPHEESWLGEEHADLWMGFEVAEVAQWMHQAGLSQLKHNTQNYVDPAHADASGANNLQLFVLSGQMPQ